MKQKIFLMLALLCAVVQGVWAQNNWGVWDGHSEEKPPFLDGGAPTVVIESGAHMLYIRNHWDEPGVWIGRSRHKTGTPVKFKDCNYILGYDIDMTNGNWTPFDTFKHEFDGRGHGIKLKIDDGRSSNCLGVFSETSSDAVIKNLHVDALIKVGKARKVGAIVGDNYGTVENCWVSGHVESSHYSSYDADLGGVVGLNEGTVKFCCMSGNVKNTGGNSGVGGIVGGNKKTVEHCTFFGNVDVDHKQDSKSVGEQNGTSSNLWLSYNAGEYNAAAGKDMYRNAIKYTHPINVSITGCGGLEFQDLHYTETITRWHSGAWVNIIQKYGTMTSYSVRDANNNDITNSLEHDNHSFVMPNKPVTVAAVFTMSDWFNHTGTESDPYLISSQSDWFEFANSVSCGKNYEGQYVKLVNDISVSAMAGNSETNSFQGTFDGNGHKLTFTQGSPSQPFNEDCCAPFRYVKDATIHDLHVDGNIYTSHQKASGFVGFMSENLSINNCRSSVNIYSYVSGEGTHGGFLGILANNWGHVNIDRCIFDGSFNSDTGTNSCAGFIGWANTYYSDGITNSLMKPSAVTAGMLGATFIRAYRIMPTLTNTYVVDTPNLPTYQGTKIYTSTAVGEIYKKVTAIDNNEYYIPCTVSNVQESYQYTGNAITVTTPTVKAANGATLRPGTDFTFTPTSVTDAGTYDLTITGQGGYGGTKTITIFVGDVNSETLTAGEYTIHNDLTIDWRIDISGDVVINIPEDVTLTAKKGFEVSAGNSLTINGPGALVINNCDNNKSGIGLTSTSSLIINGGQLTIAGGSGAVGIGANSGAASGTLKLGWTNANTDYVQCNSYAVSNIVFDKRFALNNTTTIATADNIAGKKIVPFEIAGTEEDPYTISSADEWNAFAEAVNTGNNYSGKYVKLMGNISVSTMAGTDDANSFQGTFDGNDKTLTFTKGSSLEPFNENYCAPFRHVKNATIKKLHVEGTIYTSVQKAAGFVGESHGALNINYCHSSINIHSSRSGDGTHGGFVATLSGADNTITIDHCVFDGSFATTAGTGNCGGFIGWPVWNRPTISNSLMKPTSVDAGMLNNTFARWHTTYEPTITNCYYLITDNLPNNQGLELHTADDGGGIFKQITAADNNTYYLPCSVSNVQEGYLYNGGNDITVNAPTVTAIDGTVLTAGVDFTYSPTTVSEKRNDYKLTVSGTGIYTGSKTFDFIVGDYAPITSATTELTTGTYMAYNDVTNNHRITISGVVTLYLDADATLRALKGFELTSGNSLTIYGPGALVINGCDENVPGIGGDDMGSLTINGGQLDIEGGGEAAGIGYAPGQEDSGTLTFNWTDATDFVRCSSYAVESITFAKPFVIDNDLALATTSNINGMKIVPVMVLADKGDNSAVLTENDSKQWTVGIEGRTLYLDGKWNTICLPFDYNISEFRDVVARELTAASINGTTLSLTFSDSIKTLKAGTPYIIKFEKAEDYDEASVATRDLTDPVFEDVTIDNTDNSFDTGSGDTRVRFLCTYDAVTFTNDNKTGVLLLGGDNKLRYAGNGAKMGAFRAYFKIGEDGGASARVTSFNIDFGEGESETTGITVVSGSPADTGVWYDLQGRKLQGKPTAKGLYIVNGKTVVL